MTRRRQGHSGAFILCIVLLAILIVMLYFFGDRLPIEQWHTTLKSGREQVPGIIRDAVEDLKVGGQQAVDFVKDLTRSEDSYEIEKPNEAMNLAQAATDLTMRVHSFNMGDADVNLILLENKAMLFGVGVGEYTDKLITRLKELGVEHINCIVCMRTHKDYVDAMSKIVQTFSPEVCYLPDQPEYSDEYIDLLSSLKAMNATMISPKDGEALTFGDANIAFFLPASQINNSMDDRSIIIRLKYKEKSFLFVGNASSTLQSNLIHSSAAAPCSVIKFGKAIDIGFLNAVKPQYAILGYDNDIRMDEAVRACLEKLNVTVLYAKNGEIVFTVEEDPLSLQILNGI